MMMAVNQPGQNDFIRGVDDFIDGGSGLLAAGDQLDDLIIFYHQPIAGIAFIGREYGQRGFNPKGFAHDMYLF
jgi:hypothetical protein